MLPYFKEQGSKTVRFHPSPHGIGVSTYSKNQKEAFAYIAWFTSQEIARDYVTTGGGHLLRARNTGRRGWIIWPPVR